MLFTSITFLFVFLPLLLVMYYLIPRKGKNGLLLLYSLLFYTWGGVSYSIILILSILFNYWFASRLSSSDKNKRNWLRIGILFNVLLLMFFKYADFFVGNINDVSWLLFDGHKPLTELNIILPLGISFFTFQQMSMLWDVHKNPQRHTPTLIDTALYVSFFPQLVAGPIVRYHDIINQIKTRTESIELMNSGIQRFIIGLFKKMVIANSCAAIVDSILINDFNLLSPSAAWLAILAYALQIYFDFSGYSDMAIGLGRMFGFQILENFNFPYMSRSVKEFWQRWHISLSSWFKDYVYIPLGGNKIGVRRTYVNLMIVFVLTGFWHGASWSFVFWGMFHGLFLIIERLGFDLVLKRLPKFVGWSYTLLVVLIGWVFFRVEDFVEALSFIQTLFGGGADGVLGAIDYLNGERIAILLIAVLMCAPLFSQRKESTISPFVLFIKNIGLTVLFLYCILLISSGSYNPFIYFRF